MAFSKQSVVHVSLAIVLGILWSVVLSLQFWLMQAGDFDAALLQSSDTVQVLDSDEATQFVPVQESERAAMLFYPGALADPDAYAPMLHAVAEAGHRVVLVKVPYRVAFFQWQEDEVASRTLEMLGADNNQHQWVIGGHSKGGAMAAAFARDHADRLAGLLLIGTTHPRRDDLSRLSLDVTKVFASEDGLAGVEEVYAFSKLLPATTNWVCIEGGNHTQFAWYRWQLGDQKATLTREAQQEVLIDAVLEQLQRVSRQDHSATTMRFTPSSAAMR